MTDWISVDEQLPPENQTVLAYSKETKFVFIGAHVYLNDDGWFWSKALDCDLWIEDGNIVTECEIDDDYQVTHWHPLPKIEHL
jgi:hypothetical protein